MKVSNVHSSVRLIFIIKTIILDKEIEKRQNKVNCLGLVICYRRNRGKKNTIELSAEDLI